MPNVKSYKMSPTYIRYNLIKVYINRQENDTNLREAIPVRDRSAVTFRFFYLERGF